MANYADRSVTGVIAIFYDELGLRPYAEIEAQNGSTMLFYAVGKCPIIVQVWPDGLGWQEYIAPPWNETARSIANLKRLQEEAKNGTQA